MFSVRLTNATPRCFELADGLQQVLERAAEPVQPPHHHGVTGPGLLEQIVQRRSGLELPAGLVHEDAVAAGALQRVPL